MAIDICVPTYNRLPHLKKQIELIRDGIEDYPYHFIVSDGGSTDGTIEYLKKQKDVTLIEMGELTGCIKAYNAAFKKSKNEYVFWPSDDFVIKPKVLIKCCKLMDKYPEIGMVSPKMIEPTYANFPNFGKHHYLITSKTHVFRSSVLKEINLLDEKFRMFHPDSDTHFSILNLGYATIFSKEVGVIHTRVHDEIRKIYSPTDEEIEKYYIKKWEKFSLKLDGYSPIFWKQKASLFLFLRKLFHFRLIQPLMKKQNPLIVYLYDWFLQRCIVFKAKEYNHLKDFYLAQKIPKDVLEQ